MSSGEVLPTQDIFAEDNFAKITDRDIHQLKVNFHSSIGRRVIGEMEGKDAIIDAALKQGGSAGLGGKSSTGKTELGNSVKYVIVNGEKHYVKLSGEGDYTATQLSGARQTHTSEEVVDGNTTIKNSTDIIDGQIPADTWVSFFDERSRANLDNNKVLLPLTEVDTKAIYVPGVGYVELEDLIVHIEGFNPGRLKDGIIPMTYANKARYTDAAVVGIEPDTLEEQEGLFEEIGLHILQRRADKIAGKEEDNQPYAIATKDAMLAAKKYTALRTVEIFKDDSNKALAEKAKRIGALTKHFVRERYGMDFQGFGRVAPAFYQNVLLASLGRGYGLKPDEQDMAKAGFKIALAPALTDKDIVMNAEILKAEYYSHIGVDLDADSNS